MTKMTKTWEINQKSKTQLGNRILVLNPCPTVRTDQNLAKWSKNRKTQSEDRNPKFDRRAWSICQCPKWPKLGTLSQKSKTQSEDGILNFDASVNCAELPKFGKWREQFRKTRCSEDRNLKFDKRVWGILRAEAWAAHSGQKSKMWGACLGHPPFAIWAKNKATKNIKCPKFGDQHRNFENAW